jgi:hypothetical protein
VLRIQVGKDVLARFFGFGKVIYLAVFLFCFNIGEGTTTKYNIKIPRLRFFIFLVKLSW